MATDDHDSVFDPQELRRKAVERVRARHGRLVDMPAADVETLVHELEVYQVELEVQNEELRRTQLELASALERYQDLYDRAPVGYLTLDDEGIVLRANLASAQLFFRDRQGLEGQRLESLALRADRDKLWVLLQNVLVSGLPQSCDFRIGRRSGPPRWVHADITLMDRPRESASSFRMTLTDITARVHTEQALEEQRAGAIKLMKEAVDSRAEAERVSAELRESEERFRTLADNISPLAWIAEPNGERVWFNKRWLEYTGMTIEEGQGMGWMRVHHPDHLDRVKENIRLAWNTGEPWEDTFPLLSKTGEYRSFLTRAVPIRDTEGNVVHWFGTSVDITEREQLLSEEQRLREVAEAHNRAKDEFLALVSHELRTPLNSIMGYAQLMRGKPRDAAMTANALDVILRNARAQLQLIDDLLDSGRIITGKLHLEMASVDLRLLLEQTVETVLPSANARGIDLVARLDDAPQTLLCDPARLRQVIWNLLQNAIKFTPEGGRVELRVERDDRHVRLIVSDTGRGIDPDFLPGIFNRFSQGDMSSTRRHGGLGLGLALSRQLVEMHGGTVEAASPGAGQGATFTVTLPLHATLTEEGVHPASEVLPLEKLPRLDGLRTLVVDDQEDARKMIAEMLSEQGAEVTLADSSREALELLEGTMFDALVCDIAMPEMDGYEMIRHLRAREADRGGRLPAIALTALTHPEARLQALQAGFQAHVSKPVTQAELVIVLASIGR